MNQGGSISWNKSFVTSPFVTISLCRGSRCICYPVVSVIRHIFCQFVFLHILHNHSISLHRLCADASLSSPQIVATPRQSSVIDEHFYWFDVCPYGIISNNGLPSFFFLPISTPSFDAKCFTCKKLNNWVVWITLSIKPINIMNQ